MCLNLVIVWWIKGKNAPNLFCCCEKPRVSKWMLSGAFKYLLG